MDSPATIRRRGILRSAAIGILSIPLLALLRPRSSVAAAMPALDERDPQAKALGYVTDAGRVDAKSNASYKPGQTCANCLQLTGAAGETLRPCNLFPGKLVNSGGWCKAWVKKA